MATACKWEFILVRWFFAEPLLWKVRQHGSGSVLDQLRLSRWIHRLGSRRLLWEGRPCAPKLRQQSDISFWIHIWEIVCNCLSAAKKELLSSSIFYKQRHTYQSFQFLECNIVRLWRLTGTSSMSRSSWPVVLYCATSRHKPLRGQSYGNHAGRKSTPDVAFLNSHAVHYAFTVVWSTSGAWLCLCHAGTVRRKILNSSLRRGNFKDCCRAAVYSQLCTKSPVLPCQSVCTQPPHGWEWLSLKTTSGNTTVVAREGSVLVNIRKVERPCISTARKKPCPWRESVTRELMQGEARRDRV